jgi:serine/threonine protein kinase
MVIEFCSGGDLRTRLDTDRAIIDTQRRRWILDIAIGMKYLYINGVEHRDLKTANVLLDHSDRVKVSPTAVAYQ